MVQEMFGMGGGVGGGFHHSSGGHIVSSRSIRASAYDSIYGEGWQENALKTLEQELKNRGIEPKSGDDGYQVVPTPRLVGDRVSLGMILSLIAFLGLAACWAWWEYLPDDGSPFYTQRTRVVP